MHHRAVRDEREVGSLARDARLAQRHDVLASRNVLLGRAVVELGLEHHDRVRIADRRREETLRIGGRRRNRDLHPGRVDVVRLRRVVVELRGADPTAVRHPDRERERHRPAGAPPVPPHVVDELVERRVAERVVLHLDHGAPAGHAETDGRPDDPSLGERRVHAPVLPETLLQARGGTEYPSEGADVLAHDHDRLVALHLDVERVVHRLDEQELSHRGSSAARPARRGGRAAGPRRRGRTRASDPPAARPRPRRSRPA